MTGNERKSRRSGVSRRSVTPGMPNENRKMETRTRATKRTKKTKQVGKTERKREGGNK